MSAEAFDRNAKNHYRMFINGKLASEFTEYLRPQRRLPRGMIQLQVHDPDVVVHFKDVRIKIGHRR